MGEKRNAYKLRGEVRRKETTKTYSNECSQALASIVSMCNLHVIFFIEDDTEILYTIYKWNVPSIQRKKRIRRSSSMREVDRPHFVFIDFHIPAITSGCHGI
jgi:hypothetical protein